MLKRCAAITLSLICPVLLAQASNNDAVLRMLRMGFPEDMIVKAITHSPSVYDTSVDGLIALKKAGVSNNIVAAMVRRADPDPVSSAPAGVMPRPAFVPPVAKAASLSITTPVTLSTGIPETLASSARSSYPPPSGARPRVFLESKSRGDQWTATRDQSMEMSRDFERVCPLVRMSVDHSMADYIVSLNHIEQGFFRDNQMQVANRAGDLISTTKEGGSIKRRVKKACDDISADWAIVNK